MAFRNVLSSKIPMVIIMGATGTGKTKLSLELAQKFGTEIISADSMQIYKGLDLVTAKATPQERELVPHHLLDILEPHQMFTVVDFRDRALKIIDNLTNQGKIPVVVGGTHYYIESIVYNILVEKIEEDDTLLWDKTKGKRGMSYEESHESKKAKSTVEDSESDSTDTDSNKIETKELPKKAEIANVSTDVSRESVRNDLANEQQFTNEELHLKLAAVDPVMANRLHTNNRRKIIRSLEYWAKTGRCHSEVLEEQRLSEGLLRRPGQTLVLWLQCEQTVHDQRLDARVDTMLAEGLVRELLDFHEQHNRRRIKDGSPPDYTKGIFQTLGFREFHDYLMLSEEERASESGAKLLQDSIESMKIHTRRYARRQNKMVVGRFLKHPRREVPPIYTLDTTDVSKWNSEVKNKAITIVESFINSTVCEYEPVTSSIEEDRKNIDTHSKNYCNICDRVIIGDREYAFHLKSNKHARVLKKKNKLAKQKQKDKTE